jgi:salicylate hydroxylase
MQDAKATNPQLSFEGALGVRVKGFGGGDTLSWIYQNDIKEVWEDFLRRRTVPKDEV